MADDTAVTHSIQGFVKIYVSVRGQLFEMARATLRQSSFLWRLINDEPNSEDGFYHTDRDPEKFKCLMNYLVENRVDGILPCSVVDLFNESLFYGIQLPNNDCWGTTLSYTLSNINIYDIRRQLKSFADQQGILGWATWRKRVLLDIEFHVHRTIDLNIITRYMDLQEEQQIFIIDSLKQNDHRYVVSALFRCPRTHRNDKSSKSPPQTSSSPSSSDSCPESAKDLIKQLTVQDVKAWLQNTMFHDLAETWFGYNINGTELLEIGKTGHTKAGMLILSGYKLIRFKGILNCLGFELEAE